MIRTIYLTLRLFNLILGYAHLLFVSLVSHLQTIRTLLGTKGEEIKPEGALSLRVEYEI